MWRLNETMLVRSIWHLHGTPTENRCYREYHRIWTNEWQSLPLRNWSRGESGCRRETTRGHILCSKRGLRAAEDGERGDYPGQEGKISPGKWLVNGICEDEMRSRKGVLGRGTRIYKVTAVGSSWEKSGWFSVPSQVQGGGRKLQSCKVWARQIWEGFECHAKRFRVYTSITRAIREILRNKLLGGGVVFEM